MRLPFLGLFLMFLAVLSYHRKHGTKRAQKVKDDFWERELRSNEVRRQDISGLPYITIPFETFPFGICPDEELLHCEAELSALKDAKILNLSGESNTDLKLKYGPANLAFLSDCDSNFTRLARALTAYAGRLQKCGYEREAQTVLEFGIRIGSDIRANYTMLAEIYKRNGETEKIDGLTAQAEQLDSLLKPAILKQLGEIKCS